MAGVELEWSGSCSSEATALSANLEAMRKRKKKQG